MNKGCPKCGRMLNVDVDVCPYCNYHFTDIEKVYKQAINNDTQKISKYADIIQRLTAFNFDAIIMFAIYICLYKFNPLENIINFNYANIIYLLIVLLIYVIYSSILEATPLKGTFGTRLVNIAVVDDGGYQIGFSMALKHNLLKILNVISASIGYLALLFTKHKQTAAEFFSDTYVENRILDYNKKLFYANLFLRLLSFVVDVLFLCVVWFVIDFVFNYLVSMNLIVNIEQTQNNLALCMLAIILIYFSFLDSKGGTFGKQLFDFEVTDLNGQRIGIINSFLRTILMFFEFILLPIGIFLCLTSPTKQTFKDLITKTVVVKNVYYK